MTLLDVKARLSSLSVPVLMPEERELPLSGRQAGQTGGLSGYLQAHPGGYVQLYDLTPSFTYRGIYDTLLLTVDAVAADRSTATALAATLRTRLSATPRTGGNIRTFQPERIDILPGDMFRVTVQFEVQQARTEE